MAVFTSRQAQTCLTVASYSLSHPTAISHMQRHHVLEPAGWRAKRVPDAAIPSQHGQQRPKNICLFGLFGMNNYGNDGSLEATLIFLRQTWPDANYACICVDPEKIQRRFAIATAPISWSGFTNRFLRLCDKAMGGVPRKLANWVVAVNYLRNFDVLIVPGTSALCDCRWIPLAYRLRRVSLDLGSKVLWHQIILH